MNSGENTGTRIMGFIGLVLALVTRPFSPILQLLRNRRSSNLSYSQLRAREIRVLSFDFSKDLTGPVHLSTAHVSITENENVGTEPDKHSYTALSYTWGNGPKDTIIFVDGCKFYVTNELDSALRHLQRYHEGKEVQNIWIDAISINQNDNMEKNAQLPLMKDIYRLAHEVVVWLGEENTVHTKNVIEMLEQRVQFDETGEVVLVQEMEPITGQEWASFGADLMKRPWWRRMWVIQEIVVARDAVVMCGQYTISWKKLETAAVWAMIDDKPVYNHTEEDIAKGDVYFPNVRFKRGYRMKLKAGLPMPILELLQNNASCFATNPRDMIFSLIGLATDIEFEAVLEDNRKASSFAFLRTQRLYSTILSALGFQPFKGQPLKSLNPNSKTRLVCDYEQPVDQIYIDLVQVHANTHKSLNIICLSCHPKEVKQLPSWVPDWTNLWKTSSFHLVPIDYYEPPPPELADQIPTRYIYDASRGLQPEFHFHGNDELHVSGIRFDEIKRIGIPYLDRHPPGEIFYLTLLQWRMLALMDSEEEESYVAGGSKLDAYRRTITADQTRYSARKKEGESEFDPIFCCDSSGFNPFTQLEWGVYSKSFRDDERAVYLRVSTRAFFVTEQGYYGIGPPNVQEGDCVCILSGCSVPVVLRKNQQGDAEPANVVESWFFVGECFVLGVMDGEVVQKGEVVELVLK